MSADFQFPPQGAFRQPSGQTLWRVWAPHCRQLQLVTWPAGQRAVHPMRAEGGGYFVHEAPGDEGLRYAYRLDANRERPDPASRWQPDGIHHPSALFFPEQFAWSDRGWRGVSRSDLVIYELHIGTFTPEGTFDAAIARLDALVELGVTAIEVMPIAQFPGERNWGYDGAHWSAAQNSYGGPRAFQRLVDAAHARGLAVLLDVVYNHFGPEGTYVGEFGPYFTDRYGTPWGSAVNYDGPDSDPVRRLAIDNACMWVRDFHLDGLRLDAVQMIFDLGARHLLAQLQEEVQQIAAAQQREVHVIAESNQNDPRLIRASRQGGFGLTGVWSDDFHHSLHALLSGERDGYYADFGRPEQLARCFTDVFVYDGRYSVHRRRQVGAPVGEIDRDRFVVCVKNHDQIGNRALGDRPASYLHPAQLRLACGLLLINPCIPLIFMGEEYAETRPFPFFCSYLDPGLVDAVRGGRRREFADLQFRWHVEVPDPQSPATHASARLSWDWSRGTLHAGLRRLYRELLHARRHWPPLRDRRHTRATVLHAHRPHAPSDGAPILLIERGIEHTCVACANLSGEPLPLPPRLAGRADLRLSTEATFFGGQRTATAAPESLLPYEMLVFCPGEAAG